MIVVPVKEGENIEKALKKFKRKFEKTGTNDLTSNNRHSIAAGLNTHQFESTVKGGAGVIGHINGYLGRSCSP